MRVTYLVGMPCVLGLCLTVSGLAAQTAATGRSPAAAPAKAPVLPGLQNGPAPWPREMDHLSERLLAIGLPAMPSEAFVQHIHQRLTISIRGNPTTVPAFIGINEIARFISPIHTHDTTGTVHIEAATKDTFTLGQFFDVWGVRLTAECIGGYCSKGSELLKVLSNGTPVRGDPRLLPLEDKQKIEITFGGSGPPAKN